MEKILENITEVFVFKFNWIQEYSHLAEMSSNYLFKMDPKYLNRKKILTSYWIQIYYQPNKQ